MNNFFLIAFLFLIYNQKKILMLRKQVVSVAWRCASKCIHHFMHEKDEPPYKNIKLRRQLIVFLCFWKGKYNSTDVAIKTTGLTMWLVRDAYR